jgi:hypothetical protein
MSWPGYIANDDECEDEVVDAEQFAERTQYSGFDQPEAGHYFVERGRS